MSISEYIARLEALRDAHGDIRVYEGDTTTTLNCARPAKLPSVKELAILAKRETNVRTLQYGDGPDKRSGVFVVLRGQVR